MHTLLIVHIGGTNPALCRTLYLFRLTCLQVFVVGLCQCILSRDGTDLNRGEEYWLHENMLLACGLVGISDLEPLRSRQH